MKKLLFLFVFINGLTFSQMRPGIDYMPQIAFFDFVVNFLHKLHRNIPRGDIETKHIKQNWYFDKLLELGLTNLVTEGLYNLSITDNSNNTFLLK